MSAMVDWWDSPVVSAPTTSTSPLETLDQFLNDLQVSREKPVSIYPSLTCTASSLLEKNAEECRPCGSTPLAQLFWIAPVIFVVGTSLGRSWPAQRQAFQHWH